MCDSTEWKFDIPGSDEKSGPECDLENGRYGQKAFHQKHFIEKLVRTKEMSKMMKDFGWKRRFDVKRWFRGGCLWRNYCVASLLCCHPMTSWTKCHGFKSGLTYSSLTRAFLLYLLLDDQQDKNWLEEWRKRWTWAGLSWLIIFLVQTGFQFCLQLVTSFHCQWTSDIFSAMRIFSNWIRYL